MARRKAPIKTDGGFNCRKCGKPMQRYRHPDDWKPKPYQAYWFEYWDRCKCGMMQMYEVAKRFKDVAGEPL